MNDIMGWFVVKDGNDNDEMKNRKNVKNGKNLKELSYSVFVRQNS